MNASLLDRHPGPVALLGLALSLPASLLCAFGLAYGLTGSVLATRLSMAVDAHPALLVGGLLVALLLNALVTAGFHVGTTAEAYVVRLSVRRRPANLAVVGLVLVLMGLIGLYGVAENFTLTPR